MATIKPISFKGNPVRWALTLDQARDDAVCMATALQEPVAILSAELKLLEIVQPKPPIPRGFGNY